MHLVSDHIVEGRQGPDPHARLSDRLRRRPHRHLPLHEGPAVGRLPPDARGGAGDVARHAQSGGGDGVGFWALTSSRRWSRSTAIPRAFPPKRAAS
ncbi:hypothetical protein AB5I41_20060 [Sphingomonas sp. MMS24-JH45]